MPGKNRKILTLVVEKTYKNKMSSLSFQTNDLENKIMTPVTTNPKTQKLSFKTQKIRIKKCHVQIFNKWCYLEIKSQNNT